MSSSETISGERKQVLNDPRYGAWLGGVLETGGAIYFAKQKKVAKGKEYVYASPIITVTDNHRERLDQIGSIFGGTITYKGDANSWVWRYSGRKVLDLVDAFAPFAPARRDIILTMTEWESADHEERLQIADEARSLERFSVVAPDVYDDLITNPSFLAGVIDIRGYLSRRITHVKCHEYQRYTIIVQSQNRGLLEALTNPFGGQLGISTLPGTIKDIKGEKHTFVNTSYEWRNQSNSARDLLQFIATSSLLRGNEIMNLLVI